MQCTCFFALSPRSAPIRLRPRRTGVYTARAALCLKNPVDAAVPVGNTAVPVPVPVGPPCPLLPLGMG